MSISVIPVILVAFVLFYSFNSCSVLFFFSEKDQRVKNLDFMDYKPTITYFS